MSSAHETHKNRGKDLPPSLPGKEGRPASQNSPGEEGRSSSPGLSQRPAIPGSKPQTPSSLDSARVHYQRWGNGSLRAVLIHPIGFDHHTWEPIVPYLEDLCQLVALDLPGHGESDKPPGADYSIPSLASRVLHFLKELEWEDAVFIGNSIGGGVSLAAAVQAPSQVKALALCNTVGFRNALPAWLGSLSRLPIAPLLSGYAPSTAMQWGLRFARSGWTRADNQLCQRCSRYLRAPEGRSAFFSTLRELYGSCMDGICPRFNEIQCPTLLIHGLADPLIRFRHSEQLAAAIPGATLVPLPRCGHFPQEECPEAVGSQIRQFLERVISDQ